MPEDIDGPIVGLPKEHIPHVYFKQYLPVSNKVRTLVYSEDIY